MSSVNAVSIVIPVVSDVDDALAALESVVSTTDESVHSIFVIDDLPGTDGVGSAALEAAVKRVPNARYDRNPQRIGYVGSANRAVYELDHSTRDVLLLDERARLVDGSLDELISVLALSEKHVIVAPRSNSAIMTSIPSSPKVRDRDGAAERSKDVFDSVNAMLPRFSIAPVVDGFCVLIRRLVVDNHRLFVPGLSTVQAVAEFCLRTNQVGYSAVIANRSFAVNEQASVGRGMISQILPKAGDGADGSQRLTRDFPYLPLAIRDFELYGMGAVDRFADLLTPEPGAKKRVLVDLYHMSLNYDGSSRYALSFLDHLRGHAATANIDFFVSSSKEAIEFFHLKDFGFPTLSDEDFTDVIFDLGIALCPATISADQLVRMNAYCMRWVVSHLDVISLRSWHLRSIAWSRRVSVRDSFRYAEKVITISDFSVKDAFDYYATEIDGYRTKFASVLMGHSTKQVTTKTSGLVISDLPVDIQKTIKSGSYVFVMGNGFPHKQVQQALDALEGSDLNVIVLGSIAKGAYTTDAGHHSLPSGRVSEQLMHRLYSDAQLIVFPSAYEGFGLPIAEAAAEGQRIVAFDTEVSREVVKVLEIDDIVTFFDSFAELDSTIHRAIASGGGRKPVKRVVRDLSEYNAGVLDEILLQLQNENVDISNLTNRWDHFVSLPQYELSDLLDTEDTEQVSNPRNVAIIGMPTHARLGSRANIHFGFEGGRGRPIPGKIAIFDGATRLGARTLRSGEASVSIPFNHEGKRLLSIIHKGESSTVQIGVAIVDVRRPKPIDVTGPRKFPTGERAIVAARIKARKGERGEFTVSEGGKVIARVASTGGSAEVAFTPRLGGGARIALFYETVEEERYSCGRAILSDATGVNAAAASKRAQ